jgi:hypothetical protein
VKSWEAVATAFDAELYLRLEAERVLLDSFGSGRGAPWDSPLLETAAALVAVDALEETRAQDIVDDYAMALSLRGQGQSPMGMGRPGHQGRAPAHQLSASRIVICDEVFEEPWGRLHVHYVALGDRSTSVAVTAHETSPGTLLSHGRGLPGGSVQQPPLTDDQGHTEIAHFNGGFGGGTAEGRLTTMAPLSPSTAWIDIGPTRVELRGDTTPPPVRVEDLPESSPAERHLRGRLSFTRHGPMIGPGPSSIEPTIDTLLAAGALQADSPVIDEVRAVLDALTGQPAKRRLPEPWASLLAGQNRRGPTGMVALGVVTPPFDDTVVSFEALISGEESFEVHVAVSPDAGGHRGPFRMLVTESPLTWWAEDDRGNHYQGAPGRWGSDGLVGEGTLVFSPPLDRSATELRLIPTMNRQRAVVTVALPDWEAPR